MTVTKIDIRKPVAVRRLRVAAYARVSVDYAVNEHSLSAQISYYNSLIQKNPEWSYAGVYSDLGITGTKIDRPGFKRLLDDARSGKIDLILTKSISRFARNTVDLLNVVRELNRLEVPVYFEKENIWSNTADGELMLTLLASLAQAESLSISENVRWRIRKDFEQGIHHTYRLYGYDRIDGELVIDDYEAGIVRLIFHMYLEGKSPDEISKWLTEKGVKSPSGCDSFGYNKVCDILRDLSYTGDMVLQKKYISDTLAHKKMINRGELSKFIVENVIPQIIDKDTFEKVQTEIERRASLGIRAKTSAKFTPFTSKVICSKCGKSYRRQTKGKWHIWICSSKIDGRKTSCDCCNVPEKVLVHYTRQILGIYNFDDDDFCSKIDHIEVCDDCSLVFLLKDGTAVARKWSYNRSHQAVIEEDVSNA